MKLLRTFCFLTNTSLVGPHSKVLSLVSLIGRTVCFTAVSFNNLCSYYESEELFFYAVISVCIKYIFLELSRPLNKAN